MTWLDQHLVSLVVFAPLVFGALVALLPKGEKGQIRALTLLGMAVNFALCLWMYLRFDPSGAEFQMEERARWIDEVGIGYHVGVDGLAVSLMLLTGLLGPLVVLGSWTYIEERVKEFHLALLLLQTAMLGALAALDLVLFYVFWEAMLIPMYLLIGVWGSEERQMAAMKFFLYTLAGSLLMLVAILALFFMSQPQGARSFDFAAIYNALLSANRELACKQSCPPLSELAQALRSAGPWLFLAFALAFAIKVPVFPLHTWLPDAHVQAPAAGSVILAGVLLKMGTFGFWRYAVPLFPHAARDFRPLFAALAVLSIVYGALMCLAQRDIKKLIAYSSVSHLGFVMLGLFALTPEGASGAAYQMLSHGVSTGALFLLFGLLYERRHVRLMSDYGGIASTMPVFAAVFLVITFSSIAVPGTNGFVGEFLVLLGSFKSGLPLLLSVLAATGVVFGAAYMLWMVQRVFFGQLTHRENAHLRDLNVRELLSAAPFVVLVLVMGLWPQPFLDRLEPSTERYVARAMFGAGEAYKDEAGVRMEVAPLPEKQASPTVAAPPPPPRAARPDALRPLPGRFMMMDMPAPDLPGPTAPAANP